MTENFATALRLTVISAETDALALNNVCNEIRTALETVEGKSYVDLWETDLEKQQFIALVEYLNRATGFASLGAILLDAGARDEAWAILAAASRTVDAMLEIHHDTDPTLVAEDCHRELDHLTRASNPAATGRISMTESVDGPLATATTLADIRLHRTPEVFLNEADLDIRFTQTAWDLLAIAHRHIDRHLESWNGVEALRTILDGARQARAERDAHFPSTA